MSKIVVQKGKEKRLVTICEIKGYRQCFNFFYSFSFILLLKDSFPNK